MTGAVDRAFIDPWQRGAEELGDLHPHGLRLTADHGQDREIEPGCLLGIEDPLAQRGQLDAEERVGVS